MATGDFEIPTVSSSASFGLGNAVSFTMSTPDAFAAQTGPRMKRSLEDGDEVDGKRQKTGGAVITELN